MDFFQRFEIVAEVAHVLRRSDPEEIVYIDVCIKPVDATLPNVLKYPARTTLTAADPHIIKSIPPDLKPGAVVRGMGAFTQGSYVPYKTTCIDTEFELTGFEVLNLPTPELTKPVRNEQRASKLH